ncbi:hypothetical protein BaRGS_00022233, partial [Batillaria attramentaria]
AKAEQLCDANNPNPYQCLDYPYAICFGGKCVCNESTHFTSNDTCKRRIRDLNITNCNPRIPDRNQCLDPYATCNIISSVCDCDKDHFISGTSCVERLPDGVKCDINVKDEKQCADNAHCAGHGGSAICICNWGFVFSDGACTVETTVSSAAGTTTTAPQFQPPLDVVIG